MTGVPESDLLTMSMLMHTGWVVWSWNGKAQSDKVDLQGCNVLYLVGHTFVKIAIKQEDARIHTVKLVSLSSACKVNSCMHSITIAGKSAAKLWHIFIDP